VAGKRVGRYPTAFREMAIERMKNSNNITALAKELGIERRNLYTWREQQEAGEDRDWPRTKPGEQELREEIAQLGRLLGDKAVELDFFRGALQKIEARRGRSESSGGKASTTRSGK